MAQTPAAERLTEYFETFQTVASAEIEDSLYELFNGRGKGSLKDTEIMADEVGNSLGKRGWLPMSPAEDRLSDQFDYYGELICNLQIAVKACDSAPAGALAEAAGKLPDVENLIKACETVNRLGPYTISNPHFLYVAMDTPEILASSIEKAASRGGAAEEPYLESAKRLVEFGKALRRYKDDNSIRIDDNRIRLAIAPAYSKALSDLKDDVEAEFAYQMALDVRGASKTKN